jgi:hypothetical protein
MGDKKERKKKPPLQRSELKMYTSSQNTPHRQFAPRPTQERVENLPRIDRSGEGQKRGEENEQKRPCQERESPPKGTRKEKRSA